METSFSRMVITLATPYSPAARGPALRPRSHTDRLEDVCVATNASIKQKSGPTATRMPVGARIMLAQSIPLILSPKYLTFI